MYLLSAADQPKPEQVGHVGDNRVSAGSDKPHPIPRSIDSRQLFGSAETLHIQHDGVTYTLRKTRSGKLILNK